MSPDPRVCSVHEQTDCSPLLNGCAELTQPPRWRLLFGYTHVLGVPLCPCRDPGDYLLAEQSTIDPHDIRFTCWCGRKVTGRVDSLDEIQTLVTEHRVNV